MNQLLLGDSLEVLKTIESDSVDLLCTDPPYGYSFMGKSWDRALPDIGIFKECLRVLKPGAFAFVMSAPRSDVCSRMAILLEDAGFNIAFTPIYWTYACLSDDTEVLTQEGWKNYNQLRMSRWSANIAIYEDKSATWEWESPSAWNITDVHEDLYRIESDETDQLVTGNHRVVTTKGIVLASNLPEQVEVLCVPSMSDGVRDIPSGDTEETGDSRYVLHDKLSSESKRAEGDSPQQGERDRWAELDDRAEAGGERSDEREQEPGLEGRGDDVQEERKLQGHQVSSSTGASVADGPEGQIHHGASSDRGESSRETFNEGRVGTPHQSRPDGQSAGELNAFQDEQGTQAVRTRVLSKATVGRVSRVAYTGMVYCPTVSTGLFLARRNGKVFITGNSGFPKAMNIGKMVDKREGITRKVIGTKQYAGPAGNAANFGVGDLTESSTKRDLTEAESDAAKALDGSYGGFQPKPAVEVVIVAMKPLSEKTYVDQALKNGKGITWLDDCRVPTDTPPKPFGNPTERFAQDTGGFTQQEYTPSSSGRFPANLLVSDDVLNDGKDYKGFAKQNLNANEHAENIYEIGLKERQQNQFYGDSGSYSRFFSLDAWAQTLPFLAVPKASKREKNEGLDSFSEKTKSHITSQNFENAKTGSGNERHITHKNHHPTVKPLKLMSYLITLGSRPGDIVLDPFVGSGTTAIAAKQLGREYIGIEREQEYYEIAEARLAAVPDSFL